MSRTYRLRNETRRDMYAPGEVRRHVRELGGPQEARVVPLGDVAWEVVKLRTDLYYAALGRVAETQTDQEFMFASNGSVAAEIGHAALQTADELPEVFTA